MVYPEKEISSCFELYFKSYMYAKSCRTGATTRSKELNLQLRFVNEFTLSFHIQREQILC